MDGFHIFIWVLVLALAVIFGMWKTHRRNSEPIYHELLSKLFRAADVTDDIDDDCREMVAFMNEIRKLQVLDGGLAAGKRIAHLATMVPHYGDATPLVRSRAKLILDRIARNGVHYEAHTQRQNSSAPEVLSQRESSHTNEVSSGYLDEKRLLSELDTISGINADFKRELFGKHIRYLQNNNPWSITAGRGALLVLIERAKPRANQKKPAKLRVIYSKVGGERLELLMDAYTGTPEKDKKEAGVAATYSLFEKEPSTDLSKDSLRAIVVLASLNPISVKDLSQVLTTCTPIIYCLWDRGDDTYSYFRSFSMKARINVLGGEMRDFSYFL